MASQLEKIADAVRTLGAGSSPHMQVLQQSQRSAGQLATAVQDPGLPSAQQAAQYLDTARRALVDAIAELGEFQQDANAFAARLAGGGGGRGDATPGTAAALGAVTVAAAGFATAAAAPSEEQQSAAAPDSPLTQVSPKSRRSRACDAPLKQQAKDENPATRSAKDDHKRPGFDDLVTLSLDIVDFYKSSLDELLSIQKSLGIFGPTLDNVLLAATVYSMGKAIRTAKKTDDKHERGSAVISAGVGVAQIAAGVAAITGATAAFPVTAGLSVASLTIGFTELAAGKPFTKALADFPDAIRKRFEKKDA